MSRVGTRPARHDVSFSRAAQRAGFSDAEFLRQRRAGFEFCSLHDAGKGAFVPVRRIVRDNRCFECEAAWRKEHGC